MGEHAPGVAGQQSEHRQLLAGEAQLGPVERGHVGIDVDDERAATITSGAPGADGVGPPWRSATRIRASSSGSENGLVT